MESQPLHSPSSGWAVWLEATGSDGAFSWYGKSGSGGWKCGREWMDRWMEAVVVEPMDSIVPAHPILVMCLTVCTVTRLRSLRIVTV